jgi:hypothetical protein
MGAQWLDSCLSRGISGSNRALPDCAKPRPVRSAELPLVRRDYCSTFRGSSLRRSGPLVSPRAGRAAQGGLDQPLRVFALAGRKEEAKRTLSECPEGQLPAALQRF